MSIEFEPQGTLFEIGPEIAAGSGAYAHVSVSNTPPPVPEQLRHSSNTGPDDNTIARANTLEETGQINGDQYRKMIVENDTTAPGSSSAQATGNSTSQRGSKSSRRKKSVSGIGREIGTDTGSDTAGAMARKAYEKRVKSGDHLKPMSKEARASLSGIQQELDRAEEARWRQELIDQGKTGDALENALNARVIAREDRRERKKKNPLIT